MSAAEILEQIRSMPETEKREFFEQMWDEFSNELEHAGELTQEQAAELDRRFVEFEKNPQGGIPLEEVNATIKRRFGWK